MTDIDESVTSVLEIGENSNEPVKTYTIEILFKNLGDCGCFQVIVVSLGYFTALPATWALVFIFFAGYNPGWTCQDRLAVNATEFLKSSGNISLSATQDGRSLSGNETSFSSCDAMRLCENVTFNGGVSTIVTEWGMVCDNAWKVPITLVIQMSGLILGSAISGLIGDNLGRKFTLHGSDALLAITHIIAIFSVSWEMYVVLRFFIGIGCGCILSSVAVYNFEFIPGRWRGYIGAGPTWNVFTTTFALCVMALKNWKHIHIAIALASLLAFLPVFWLPESLRFLAVHGKLQKGHKVIQQIARLNRKPVPDALIMSTVAEREKEIMKSRTRYTYRDLFHTSIRKYSIVLGMAWFVFSAETYITGFGLSALSGDFFVNFLVFTSIPIPMRLVAPVLATKLGRKYASTIFIFLSGVCCFSFVAVQLLASEADKGILSLVFAFGTHMMLQAAWGPVVVMSVELFPTGIRNLSHGCSNLMARLGAIIGPYLIQKNTLPLFGSFLIHGLLQIILVVALLTLPETRGRPLPDNLLTKSEEKKTENTFRSSDL